MTNTNLVLLEMFKVLSKNLLDKAHEIIPSNILNALNWSKWKNGCYTKRRPGLNYKIWLFNCIIPFYYVERKLFPLYIPFWITHHKKTELNVQAPARQRLQEKHATTDYIAF